jgi:GTPase SAR1 family protein
LVFIGLDNSGKTTLFSLLKNGKIVASPPTGQPTSEVLIIENVELTTFDLGGHKQGFISKNIHQKKNK